MNYFTYNGVRSIDMDLRIESKNIFSAPEYDATFKSIPGRSGDLILPNGRYPNVQITYTVFVVAKTISELAEKIKDIKSWLYQDQNSYHRLTDTYDTTYYRQAVYTKSLDIEEQLNKIGQFTVSFSCKPFRYRCDGQTEMVIPVSGTVLTNPEAFPSRPIISITGDGTITLNIQNDAYNGTWKFSDFKGYIVCDSELMNFYSGTTLLNNKVIGSGFPILYPGDTTISWVGPVTELKIVPRWVAL